MFSLIILSTANIIYQIEMNEISVHIIGAMILTATLMLSHKKLSQCHSVHHKFHMD